jgi:DNA-binding MarR family transcriptional regulator
MSEMISSLDALRLWSRVVSKNLRELPHDFSQRQIAILLSVYMGPPPHTIRGLSERLHISKPAICRAIDVLSRLDFLKRKKDELDRRNVMLQRTMAGSVFLRDFGDMLAKEIAQVGQPAPFEAQHDAA